MEAKTCAAWAMRKLPSRRPCTQYFGYGQSAKTRVWQGASAASSSLPMTDAGARGSSRREESSPSLSRQAKGSTRTTSAATRPFSSSPHLPPCKRQRAPPLSGVQAASGRHSKVCSRSTLAQPSFGPPRSTSNACPSPASVRTAAMHRLGSGLARARQPAMAPPAGRSNRSGTLKQPVREFKLSVVHTDQVAASAATMMSPSATTLRQPARLRPASPDEGD